MSLKQTLLTQIQDCSALSLNQIYAICDKKGRKHDNASRRLRELMAEGLIKPFRNEKGAIIAYCIAEPTQSPKIENNATSVKPTQSTMFNNHYHS